MKTKIILCAALSIFILPMARGEDPAPGAATLQLDRRQKTVELVPAGKETFAYVRVRLPRKKDRPLELRLHALEPNQSPVRYQGTFRDWEGSMAGIEVEVSVDKKTWRKLKNVLKRAF